MGRPYVLRTEFYPEELFRYDNLVVCHMKACAEKSDLVKGKSILGNSFGANDNNDALLAKAKRLAEINESLELVHHKIYGIEVEIKTIENTVRARRKDEREPNKINPKQGKGVHSPISPKLRRVTVGEANNSQQMESTNEGSGKPVWWEIIKNAFNGIFSDRNPMSKQ